MTAVNAADEVADWEAGQLVTWRDTDVVVLDADGPWLTLAVPGSEVGWSAHESEVSAR